MDLNIQDMSSLLSSSTYSEELLSNPEKYSAFMAIGEFLASHGGPKCSKHY